MSYIFEVGTIVGHLKDDFDKRVRELHIPEIDCTEMTKIELDNTWWKNTPLGKLREAKIA